MKIKSLVCVLVDGNVRFGIITKISEISDLEGERKELLVRLQNKEGEVSAISVLEDDVIEVTAWSDSQLSRFALGSSDAARARQFALSLEPKPEPAPEPVAAITVPSTPKDDTPF